MTIQSPADDGVLRFTGALDIREADALREALSESLKQFPSLEIDLSGVESCDATALQLLIAAQKSAEGRNQAFRISAFSEAVTDACTELGVMMG